METHRLNFLDMPNFKEGENITVRLGPRWFKKVSVGNELLIYQTDDNPEETEPWAKANVVYFQVKKFLDITTGELKRICCQGVSSAETLAWTLLECYPNEFNLESDVTLLHFELVPEEEKEGSGE